MAIEDVRFHSAAALACTSAGAAAGAVPLVLASAGSVCFGRHFARTLPAAGRDSSSEIVMSVKLQLNGQGLVGRTCFVNIL